jgi:hypothetical protein
MDEMGEAWAQAPDQPRDADGHAQLLRAGAQDNRLDSLGHESRISGDCGKVEVACDRRQRSEQLANVRLVAGSVAAENVGIDQDHAAASR